MEVLPDIHPTDIELMLGFHPTDIELVSNYLKRKILGQKIEYDLIPEVDIYKHEPWDLPDMSPCSDSSDSWYFFVSRDRKYPTGSRKNRETLAGCWISPGMDRAIKMNKRTIGTKKTLVFYLGLPLTARRSQWIMHEYYIDEKECELSPDMKDTFVLCRLTRSLDWALDNEPEVSLKEMWDSSPSFNIVADTSSADVSLTEQYAESLDNKTRLTSLDGLLHDVTAEPINVQLSVLQDITNNFADERKIGQGGSGIVYKGVLQTGSVAVKKLSNSQIIEDEPFYREANFLMGVTHKNIVRFLGYCANTEQKAIKMEGSGSRQKVIYCEIRERLLCFDYMSNGGLDSHLTDELRGLEWHKRYQIIKGICEGLQYLHKEGIVHMDLKPANILLDDYMVPKITDFGISRYLDGVSRYVTKRCLVSLGYCAPEYLRGGEVSLKADIFSLGAIIRDIVTGRKQDIDSKNVLRRWRYRWNISGKYPPLGFQQISRCIEISRSCMEENPKLRPYIGEVIIDQNEEEKANKHITNAVEYMAGQISPYPWELLEIDPLELNFTFEPNKADTILN